MLKSASSEKISDLALLWGTAVYFLKIDYKKSIFEQSQGCSLQFDFPHNKSARKLVSD